MVRLIHSPTSSPTQRRRLGNFQNAVSCWNTRYRRNLAPPSLDFPPSDEDTSSGIDNTIRSLHLVSTCVLENRQQNQYRSALSAIRFVDDSLTSIVVRKR